MEREKVLGDRASCFLRIRISSKIFSRIQSVFNRPGAIKPGDEMVLVGSGVNLDGGNA